MTTRKVVLFLTCLCLLVSLATAVPGAAQPPEGEMSPEQAEMMQKLQQASTPGEPHEHLAQAEGSWKLTIKMWMEPGAEPEVSEGTAEREMIMGGRYLEERVTSTAMGMPFEGYGLTGYDNVSGKYWGVWVDSLSTGVLTSKGRRDGEAMVWHSKASDPMTGGTAEMKMVSRFHGDDKEVTEFFEMRDGQEVKTMEIVYVRQ